MKKVESEVTFMFANKFSKMAAEMVRLLTLTIGLAWFLLLMLFCI